MNGQPEFFADACLHFFRPLTGKYREQVMACLRALYARLYSSLADYSRIVQRELVLEVFQEVIARTPVLDDSEDDTALPVAPMEGGRLHLQVKTQAGIQLLSKYEPCAYLRLLAKSQWNIPQSQEQYYVQQCKQ